MSRYIIYLDTKIKGALYQTINYFKNGVFDKNTLLIYKQYKQIDKLFQKELKKANINYMSFSRYKDIPSLDNKIIFYLFNAQSNCRMVAYREATHIFVTHGESNKLSSVKPILRIYDYVITSGEAGIERLLENKIFTQCDIKHHKIIKMGNTFIGNAQYSYNDNANTLLYVPTWEGGLEDENYSSIDKTLSSFKLISKYAKEHSIKTIIIQPHPNLGHRDKNYLLMLFKGILFLKEQQLDVKLREWESNTLQKMIKIFTNVNYVDNSIDVSIGFCDISAMEVQLLDKDIPYFIFFKDKDIAIPHNQLLSQYYKEIGIFNLNSKFYIDTNLFFKIKQYYLSYENEKMKNLNFKERIDFLISTL